MVTNRDDSESSSGVQERVLSVLLNEMDGIGNNTQSSSREVSSKTIFIFLFYRGVTDYQILGGQLVKRRAAAGRRRLLFCQKLGGQLPIRQLRLCFKYYLKIKMIE